MNAEEKWRAVLGNDPAADGRFFYGVRSTGIYCRPSCASRPPRRENAVFFDSAADAVRAGFRPCKRCRPDLAAYDPAAALAAEARALIDARYADRDALREGLNALGVTRRHLAEVFEGRYDQSPEQYAAGVRLDRARAMLAAGRGVTETAFAVGMDSASAFSAFFKRMTGASPSEYAADFGEPPHCLCETPLGTVRVDAGADGLTGLRFAGEARDEGRAAAPGGCLADACAQLAEYFSGRRRSFDLPLNPRGTPFQREVWRALAEIPYGETRSYREIAEAVGRPAAARAVGMANNRNPILIVIPCHRVVGADGRLVGYAGGIERKARLLALERGGI